MVAGFSAFTCTVRSENSGVLVVAYSGITNGAPEATDNSILILLQNGSAQAPEIFDASEVWIANLGNSVSAFTDDLVSINGTATIDKTAISVLPDFGSYQLFYQMIGDSSWQQTSSQKNIAVHDDLLDTWDTHGLTAGLYNLKIVLKDVFGDSVEAISSINLLPNFNGIATQGEPSSLVIFPDPATDEINVSGDLKRIRSIVIFNNQGMEVQRISHATITNEISFSAKNFPPGIYLLQLENDKEIISHRFIVQH